ncbi:PEP-CTERM sorting domain-containing protein [Adhaeretor mobilis]|uniref:Ice-binding protein C-terminal domain-containing protein n=1 Tax=Adhaeretor mobilis TaxID=1930276 RepID=A0A517N350_9BACT|nr:PEP-CTERM sorting domain-containing protein [Adhaeretor mobilis]QDT01569.1 hypothetical protein HG15A2_49160 [Adhaeretor mobilis]
MRSTILASLAITLVCAANAHAVISTFNDKTSYDAYAAGRVLIGVEDFEQSTLPSNGSSNTAPNDFSPLSNPLTQAVENGMFPAGLIQPLTIQAVTIGDISIGDTTPLVGDVLASFPVGGFGTTPYASDVVLPNAGSAAIEIIFNSSNISAVGFNPIKNNSVVGSANVYAFDTLGNAIGSAYPTTADSLGTQFFGIGIDSGPFIGRIVIDSTSGGAIGVDNISISAIPEPSSYALLGLVTLVLGGRRALGNAGYSVKKRISRRHSASH